jgi:hypothetical protein
MMNAFLSSAMSAIDSCLTRLPYPCIVFLSHTHDVTWPALGFIQLVPSALLKPLQSTWQTFWSGRASVMAAGMKSST